LKVVWSSRSIDQLQALREFIAKDSESSAAAIARRILDAIELLKSHPNLGRPGRITGTRELIVPQTPFVVPYRVRAGRLELIGIFHGRQRWPDRL
jgi:plasmid stabilization system protein ParE